MPAAVGDVLECRACGYAYTVQAPGEPDRCPCGAVAWRLIEVDWRVPRYWRPLTRRDTLVLRALHIVPDLNNPDR